MAIVRRDFSLDAKYRQEGGLILLSGIQALGPLPVDQHRADQPCKSSTLPSSSEVALYDAMMPVLYPGNVQEILDLGLHGFALSRFSGLWVGFKIVTNVADEIGTAEVAPDRVAPIVPELRIDGRRWRPTPNPRLLSPDSLAMERELFYGHLEAAKAYA